MGAKLTEVGAVEFDKRPPCIAQYVPSISGSHACVVTVGNCATATLTIGTHKTTATSNTKRCAIRRLPQCPPAVLAHHRSTNNARNDHCMRLPRKLAAATRQRSNYGGGTHVETQVYVISTIMPTDGVSAFKFKNNEDFGVSLFLRSSRTSKAACPCENTTLRYGHCRSKRGVPNVLSATGAIGPARPLVRGYEMSGVEVKAASKLTT
jgi:hypothetical protein